jgi:transposase
MELKIKYCKLRKEIQKELYVLFLGNSSARKAAQITGVNKNTATLFFHKLRILINTNENKGKLSKEVEVDECYIGKTKKHRGRSSKNKIILVGLKQRNGLFIAKVVSNVKAFTLNNLINTYVEPKSILYTDCFRGYDKVDQSKYTHKIVNHSIEYVNKEDPTIHTNTIENMWKQLRRYLKVYNGPKKNFELFLSEALFRINNSLASTQKKLLNSWSLA